jgi:DNA-binding phage protein
MGDQEFLDRAANVTSWFDALNPYADDKPLFKVEDHNFLWIDGQVCPDVHEPLYALAISAKRYVLFNWSGSGRPIIRKALAHGLGHWLAPYKEKEAPASIPAPLIPLSEIGADRWHHDLWYRIILATLEGHPDQVDLSDIPALDRRAASRYAASTSSLLHWFDTFNANRPYCDQVKAFNFMLAFQVSKSSLYQAVADGELEDGFLDDGLPAVVAPYDSDPEHAALRCFDRRTGRPVPTSVLATYREAISAYHLHSESKFENGELFDSGHTRRRHVECVAIEYIGKEANRWEEQFYLGEIPEAQIEYGYSPKAIDAITRVIMQAARKFGMAALAKAACLSRQQLSTLLGRKAKARPSTIVSLVCAVTELELARK